MVQSLKTINLWGCIVNKYGQTAIMAVTLYANEKKEAKIAWGKASDEVFESVSARDKSCPRNAFLGLCEEGLVKDILPNKYTRSIKNKEYALRAVELLKKEPRYKDNINELWVRIVGDDKKHNSQMDVVIALYNEGLLNI